MLDAGVFVAGFALMAFVWNLSRMNDVLKEWEREGRWNNVSCRSNDPRTVENSEDWKNDELCSSADPVACCMRIPHEINVEVPSSDPYRDRDGLKATAECGQGTRFSKRDIEIFREAKRLEHFEGKVPGSLTPYPLRSMYYGRGCPSCVRRPSSISSSGYNMIG